MAKVKYESAELFVKREENVEIKTEPEEMFEEEVNSFELVPVKMKPEDCKPKIKLTEFEENNDQHLLYVCDGIVKNEVTEDFSEKPRNMTSTMKGIIHDVKVKKEGKLSPNNQTSVDVQQFKCEHCDFETNYKGSLVRHLRVHTGEKPYNCKYCDYKCSFKASIIRHERTHTGEEPFKCDKCSYRCSMKYHLVRHNRTHTGEKPFKCNLCDYKCSRKSYLVTHTRKHMGEKPFKCSICPYETGDKCNLNRHIRGKHKK